MRVPIVPFAVAMSLLLPLSGCQNGSGWSFDSLAFWKKKPNDIAVASRGGPRRPSSTATPTGMDSQPGFASARGSTPQVRVTSGVADATYNTQAGYGQGYPGMQTGAGIPAQAGRWDPSGASSSDSRTTSAGSTYQQYNRATAETGSGYAGYHGATPGYRGTTAPSFSTGGGYGDRSSAAVGTYPSAATAGGAYPQNTATSAPGSAYDYRSDAAQRGSYPFGAPGGVSYRSDSAYPGGRSQSTGTQAAPSSVYPTTTASAAGGYPTGAGGYAASPTGYSPSGGYQPPGYQPQKSGYNAPAAASGAYSSDYGRATGGSQSDYGRSRLSGMDPSQEYRPGQTGTYDMRTDSQPSSITNPYAGYPGSTTAGLPDGSSMR